MIAVQDVLVDPAERRVWRGDREVTLSRMEFSLLLALISRAGVLVTRDELMREVWGAAFYTSSKTIDVHLGWLRRKLGEDSRRPVLITTVRGRGLRFETAPRSASQQRSTQAVVQATSQPMSQPRTQPRTQPMTSADVPAGEPVPSG